MLAPLVVGGPASTLALASDLARLMDDMVTRGVPWEKLDGLVPDQLDEYWQHSLQFLQIAREAWPNYLAEIGKIEPAARRDLLISAEAARLTAHHRGPVIAAGSTGSMPTTAKFLQAVAKLPQGAVILPGLDTDLDEEFVARHRRRTRRDGKVHGTSRLEPSAICNACAARPVRHQAPRRRDSGAAVHATAATCCSRRRCGRQTRRRNGMSGCSGPRSRDRIADGMKHLAVIAAPNPEMEALAIAVALREARHLGEIGGAGDAGSRAGTAGDGGARPLEPRL